ncbi:vomeronasal 1 receptor ornAnaV1R3144 [Ornithorhynchus anatinus]|uniref:Vomeronasal type-1 receptor n=1 Tax=Ornithorhynchus anatinus TaxID=9258 RepID=A0A6I8NFY5_ORNAN|nr:vomeronasal 1 receptor ornAnaV1R3144 [Ornithorhynchus anatinus]
MVSRDLIQGICFLSQTAVGLVGNSFLLTVHVFLLPQLHQPKPTDLIVSHLALVHTVMLLTRVVTVTVSALSLRQLQTDVGCKMFAFVYRATRGVSMGTTSLLSATQAITIGPSHPSWTRLKAQMSKRIFPACVSIWFINMLVEANLLVKMVLSPNLTSRGNSFHDNYCVVSRISTYLSALLQGPLLTLMTVRDILSLGLMGGSSGYMVLLLLRHSQRVHRLHGHHPTSRTSPETQATQTILLLVSCFMVFCSGDFVLSLFLGTMLRNDPFLLVISQFVVSGYPTISPFVLLNSHRQVTKLLGSFLGKKDPIP